MKKLKVMTVFGTRPEAIKMAPLIKEYQKYPEDFQTIIEKQIINIEKYSITEAECAIKLIELAMKFPVLNQEILPQQIEVIFNSEMSQSEKINNIESILISVI